jgi:hypothetical protein
MTSTFLRLNDYDRALLKAMRIDPGPTMDERLKQFAECLDQRQKLNQLQQFVERGWNLESDAAL